MASISSCSLPVIRKCLLFGLASSVFPPANWKNCSCGLKPNFWNFHLYLELSRAPGIIQNGTKSCRVQHGNGERLLLSPFSPLAIHTNFFEALFNKVVVLTYVNKNVHGRHPKKAEKYGSCALGIYIAFSSQRLGVIASYFLWHKAARDSRVFLELFNIPSFSSAKFRRLNLSFL